MSLSITLTKNNPEPKKYGLWGGQQATRYFDDKEEWKREVVKLIEDYMREE